MGTSLVAAGGSSGPTVRVMKLEHPVRWRVEEEEDEDDKEEVVRVDANVNMMDGKNNGGEDAVRNGRTYGPRRGSVRDTVGMFEAGVTDEDNMGGYKRGEGESTEDDGAAGDRSLELPRAARFLAMSSKFELVESTKAMDSLPGDICNDRSPCRAPVFDHHRAAFEVPEKWANSSSVKGRSRSLAEASPRSVQEIDPPEPAHLKLSKSLKLAYQLEDLEWESTLEYKTMMRDSLHSLSLPK